MRERISLRRTEEVTYWLSIDILCDDPPGRLSLGEGLTHGSDVWSRRVWLFTPEHCLKIGTILLSSYTWWRSKSGSFGGCSLEGIRNRKHLTTYTRVTENFGLQLLPPRWCTFFGPRDVTINLLSTGDSFLGPRDVTVNLLSTGD